MTVELSLGWTMMNKASRPLEGHSDISTPRAYVLLSGGSPKTIFRYEENDVRTHEADGQAWFCLNDVARILDIAQPKHFLSSEWCDKDGVRSTDLTDALGRNQQTTFINEGNFYTLVSRSRKPGAIAFTRWVNHVVLPELRKGGRSFNQGVPANIEEAIYLMTTVAFNGTGVPTEVKEIAEKLERIEASLARIEGETRRTQALAILDQGFPTQPTISIDKQEILQMVDEMANALATSNTTILEKIYDAWDRHKGQQCRQDAARAHRLSALDHLISAYYRDEFRNLVSQMHTKIIYATRPPREGTAETILKYCKQKRRAS